MRIGIDMAATAGKKSGLGFYVENLVQHMQQLRGNDELVLIDRVKNDLRTPTRILWDQCGLPAVAKRRELDVLFQPAFSAPRFKKPVIMTAHDIYGVHHPEHFSRLARYYWKTLLPRTMQAADHIVCISEHTKNDLEEHLGIPSARMTVVPLAASTEFRVVNDVEWLKTQLKDMNIDSPFVLSVGTQEPRKNFPRLIEAFAFARRGQAKLVIVGKAAWDSEAIHRTIDKYNMHDTVILLDYVNADQLLALYNTCVFFILASLYEGFGLPALEAMACGAPVAVSQNSSLPEVVGDAGVMFDPYDAASIRERLDLLFADDGRRAQMQHASLTRATTFSWDRTAQETLDTIRKHV